MRKLLTIVLFIFSFSLNAKVFEHIIIFGDSLSDTGNLYNYMLHLVPKSPPYYKGHFSNGPVWTEHVYKNYFLSESGEHRHNYAAGGAPAVVDGTNTLPFSLTTEIDDYLYLHKDKNKDTTLYLMWIGGNNYIKNPGHVEDTTTKTVNGIAKNIRQLISHGAEMFLIPNLPDLGGIPEATQEHKSEALSQYANKHNEKLHQMINHMRNDHPNVVFIEFDVKSIFDDVRNHPDSYGLDNTKDACYTGSVFLKANPTDSDLRHYLEANGKAKAIKVSKKMIDSILKTPVLKEVAKVDWLWGKNHLSNVPECIGYLFFDGIHPSAYVHQRIAEYAIKEIEDANLEFRNT